MPKIGERIIREGIIYEYKGFGRWEIVPEGTASTQSIINLGFVQIHVGTSPPSDTNMLWLDIN